MNGTHSESLNWMDWSWGWTSRFFMTAGAVWMVSALVRPSIEGEWIVLASAFIAAVSLLPMRPVNAQ